MHLAPIIALANSEPTPAIRVQLTKAFGHSEAAQIAALSREQRDVLQLVVQGVPNKLMAKQLNVSVRAIEDRRARLMRRLPSPFAGRTY